MRASGDFCPKFKAVLWPVIIEAAEPRGSDAQRQTGREMPEAQRQAQATSHNDKPVSPPFRARLLPSLEAIPVRDPVPFFPF